MLVLGGEGADRKMVRWPPGPTRTGCSSPGASLQSVPEFAHHLDKRAFEPEPRREAVDGLVEFGHETVGIGLGVDQVGTHGWQSPWLVPSRPITPGP
jgi:hypothetical protein